MAAPHHRRLHGSELPEGVLVPLAPLHRRADAAVRQLCDHLKH